MYVNVMKGGHAMALDTTTGAYKVGKKAFLAPINGHTLDIQLSRYAIGAFL
jgi:hypothetical protein